MGVILALLMFNCNLNLNQEYCINKHVNCIETLVAIKLEGDLSTLSPDQKLASAYMYCVETNDVISVQKYLRMLDETMLKLKN